MDRMLEWEDDSKERFRLSENRIREIVLENELEGEVSEFFEKEGLRFIKRLVLLEMLMNGSFEKLSLDELKKWNKVLYEEETIETYQTSYMNPSYSVAKFGEEAGRVLSHISYLIGRSQSLIFAGDMMGFVRIMEFFLELYSIFRGKEGTEEVISALYYFKRDNLLLTLYRDVKNFFTPALTNIIKIIMEADLSEPSYLYKMGYFVNEDDLRVSSYLAGLKEEEIKAMAKTHIEGFIEGFKTMRVSLEGKKGVKVYAHLGFERLVREEIRQLEERGLTPFVSIMNEGANRQVDYDHKNDYGLYLDEAFVSHYLEAYEKVLTEFKEDLESFAGPAAIETFGEDEFSPENKKEAVNLSEEKRELFTKFSGKKYQILNRFAPADKRSFSIIAYPLPNISKDRYEEIFNDIIRINNMDNQEFKRIQQKIIDELDKGDFVRILGRDDNKTDMIVKLHELKHPEKETNFENCGADVNIPVGEVFTSPKLTGTKGVLHVSKVYLNGLLYKNLCLQFEDGKIVKYSVKNFEKEEDNLKFIEENLLHHHKTLPLGEFAIGTNTLAYMVGIKYDISGKLPILIAEKTGPHFAVGDTCYSMQEDHVVYNPDGKEIIARENECSVLRKTDISKAYFNCHTDITLPYSELGELTVHRRDGSTLTLMKDGRFVLAGTEELNQYLED